ncbi:MFS transporter [Lactobacillus mulieris]|uniref:MFS transporter n=1 Tax=Lactobacillus mulieris TaxID=2508708 RepID=A0AAW5WZX6_9LACO|nr:MFS transporter [Lactobacillus mulieris]MCZ3622567.1 MFS transporter [Lactobacillus mulieris]MCZ3624205.1 MFS transporter [Lactobacillus mulieris]MCZ3636574.1 MFS transporter [Lactobacillus mulieris]MCZ3690831.1 MFS transporter [Lactobacillus mulieris]MCZ3696821.1 MFS transporter [Lactobacillus mulieris]
MNKDKGKTVYTKDVILVMAASFFFMFSVMFVTPLINGYAISLGASSSFAGFVVGIMSVASLFLRPIAGNITDIFSKYRLSLIGGILIAIGIIGYVITPNSELLLLFRLINGTGFVLCTVCMTTWLGALVPRSHVGQAMGFYGLMNALDMAIAPAIAIDVYHTIGYRNSFILAAVASILMIIVIQFVENHAMPKVRKNKPKKKFKLIQKNAFPVTILTALFAIPYFITQADIVTYAEQKHLDIHVGMYFVIYAIVLLVLRIVLKNFFDTVRFGVWLYAAAASMFFYLFMLAIMTNDLMMGLAAIGMTVGYGIIYSVLQSTALLLAPLEEQGLASSTFYMGIDLGMSFGPIIAGFIDTYLPIQYFYLVQLILVPLVLIVYFVYRKRLNGAIDQH